MDLNAPQGAQPVQSPDPIQQPVQPMPQQQVSQNPVMGTPPVGQSAPVQAPKSSKKKMIVVLFVIVLLILVAVGAYAFMMNKGNTSTAGQTYVTPAKQQAKVVVSPTPEVSVNDTAQLDSAITEVNGVSTTTIDSELNQAISEAKSL